MATIRDLSAKLPPTLLRSTSWADGLRGIAAIFVVASHTSLCFATFLIPPSVVETGKSTLFQRPFFRLVIQGQAWVAMFFVLLGFVNSLKPLQLARSGAVSEALGSLSTGAFRRTGRLLARRVDVFWLRSTAPKPSVSLVAAVEDLVRELAGTWLYGENAYDQPQWALLPLFRGSLYVFMTLLALINATPRFRLCAETLLYSWSWATLDGGVGTNIFAGMMLAELSLNNCQFSASLKPRALFQTVPYGLVVLGFYLCSFPDQYAEQTAWSSQLAHIGDAIFPKGSNISRYFASIGAQIVCLGAMLSPTLRRIFSSRVLLWLGSISFPLYLIHGPLMRSVLVYLLYWPMSLGFMPALLADGTPNPESYIPTPNTFRLRVILSLFFAFLLFIVRLWSIHIEPKMGAATNYLERVSRSWGNIRDFLGKGHGLLPISIFKQASA
ncbi:Acyltransferase 3 [Penicillium waksmanii]|uniref:Acyltransferase 3 n=1 Tax=Penicillium waksmanii TaxID=69791 RepID=UPI0025483FB0|nr:Acyltransferase 3 [Penicillium waksmanii]KAJ5988941.1 Acyltransferase 3 [Penicillium waksmanii]